jgi:hypothetical protein
MGQLLQVSGSRFQVPGFDFSFQARSVGLSEVPDIFPRVMVASGRMSPTIFSKDRVLRLTTFVWILAFAPMTAGICAQSGHAGESRHPGALPERKLLASKGIGFLLPGSIRVGAGRGGFQAPRRG